MVGTQNDQIGSGGVIELSNGNYVVKSYYCDNGSFVDAGAATWSNGTTGKTSVVSSSNSLVGSKASDQVGATAKALTNGNYEVTSSNWDNHL